MGNLPTKLKDKDPYTGNTGSISPEVGEEFVPPGQFFLRRRKVVVSNKNAVGCGCFNIVDTLGGVKEVDINGGKSVGLSTLIPLDVKRILVGVPGGLAIVEAETGKRLAFRRLEDYHAHPVLSGNWIYLHSRFCIFRMKLYEDTDGEKHFSGRIESAKECVSGMGIGSRIETGSKIGMGSRAIASHFGHALDDKRLETRKSLAVWNTEGSFGLGKIERDIAITWERAELPSFLKAIDNENLLLVTSSCRVIHVNVVTGKVVYFSNPETFCPNHCDMFPDGRILVATLKEVKVVIPDWKKMEVVTKTVFNQELDVISGVCVLDEHQFFVVSTEGDYQVLNITPLGTRCICKGRLEGEPQQPKSFPIAREEDAQETVRFRKQLETHVFQVPKEILGVISAFI